eukprot:7377606-Prymnesium_polylepis.1
MCTVNAPAQASLGPFAQHSKRSDDLIEAIRRRRKLREVSCAVSAGHKASNVPVQRMALVIAPTGRPLGPMRRREHRSCHLGAQELLARRICRPDRTVILFRQREQPRHP